MAFIDTLATFSPFKPGTPDTFTTTSVATNVMDLATGACVANTSTFTTPSSVWGNSSVFATDAGGGNGILKPTLKACIITTFTSSGSATMNVQLQGAPDNGSNTYGTWTTIDESGAIPVANLTAGTQISLTINPRTTGVANYRWLRVNYTVGTAAFTAGGGISAALTLGHDTAQSLGQYPANFTVI